MIIEEKIEFYCSAYTLSGHYINDMILCFQTVKQDV